MAESSQRTSTDAAPRAPRMAWLAPLLSAALLVAMGVAELNKPTAAEAEPYHQRVRRAAAQMPYRIGDWVGSDQEPPREAIDLLAPNVIVSRVYKHRDTGETATFLLVQCKDARNMSGHYPPVCYPSHGWTANGAREIDWRVDGVQLTGTEYRFSFHRPQDVSRMVVDNFMIMPDGRILRDIEGVHAAAADYTTHFYGAAQIQLVTGPDMTEKRRRAVFRTIIGAHLDVIATIRAGMKQAQEK